MPGLLFKEASSVASIVPKKFPKHQSSIELKFQKRNRAINTKISAGPGLVTPTQVLNSVIRLGLASPRDRDLGGARQDGIHCITAHPLLKRVPGGARPDITAHLSV